MTIYSYYTKFSDVVKIQNALDDDRIKNFIMQWDENLYNKQFYKKLNKIANKYGVDFFIDIDDKKSVLVMVEKK